MINQNGLVGVGTKTVHVSGAAAAGLATVGAYAAGKNRIYQIVFTSDTACSITVNDGIGVVYIGAGGACVLDYGVVGKLQTTAATALTSTSSVAANISATVLYTTE